MHDGSTRRCEPRARRCCSGCGYGPRSRLRSRSRSGFSSTTPYWAGTSAAIVCQPQLGALRKGWFRVVGTLIGAVMSMLLTACFPQDRALFLGALVLWCAICAVAATLSAHLSPLGAAALSGDGGGDHCRRPARRHRRAERKRGLLLARQPGPARSRLGIACDMLVLVLSAHRFRRRAPKARRAGRRRCLVRHCARVHRRDVELGRRALR